MRIDFIPHIVIMVWRRITINFFDPCCAKRHSHHIFHYSCQQICMYNMFTVLYCGYMATSEESSFQFEISTLFPCAIWVKKENITRCRYNAAFTILILHAAFHDRKNSEFELTKTPLMQALTCIVRTEESIGSVISTSHCMYIAKARNGPNPAMPFGLFLNVRT